MLQSRGKKWNINSRIVKINALYWKGTDACKSYGKVHGGTYYVATSTCFKGVLVDHTINDQGLAHPKD